MSDTFVSLGGNCSVSYHLNQYGLREKAYPFDWCDMSLNSLIKVLEHNFENFDNVNIIKYSTNHPHFEEDNRGSYLLKNPYGIKFGHELKLRGDVNILKQSLLRRIKRFFKLKNPIFIRIETKHLSDEQMKKYEKLELLLDKMFENYELRLISKNKYESKKIKHIELEEFSSDWKYEELDWLNILEL